MEDKDKSASGSENEAEAEPIIEHELPKCKRERGLRRRRAKKNDDDDKTIGPFNFPKDSARGIEYAKYEWWEEDLMQIVRGNHNFSITIPDFRKMSKKQLDDYGKTVFTDEDGHKKKMFVSESRIDCMNEMKKHEKEIESHVDSVGGF